MAKIILRGKKTPKNFTILDDTNDVLEAWEWQDFWNDVYYFDKQDKAEEYIITGERVIHPHYAGYIGKGGTLREVITINLRNALNKVLSCADYGCKIEETKGGCLVITTIGHDGTNIFKIYKKLNARRHNINYKSIVWGC